MNMNDLNGRRVVCLARVSCAPEKKDGSSGEEGTTSTEAQIKLMKAFGAAKGMVFVRVIPLEGLSGSFPGEIGT